MILQVKSGSTYPHYYCSGGLYYCVPYLGARPEFSACGGVAARRSSLASEGALCCVGARLVTAADLPSSVLSLFEVGAV